jgi:hypothetical protein
MTRRTRGCAGRPVFVLRRPGLFFNGMADLFEMVLDWGTAVRARFAIASGPRGPDVRPGA